MARRAHSAKLVKIHRKYSVEEIALVVGAHKRTVRNWLRGGLPAIDDRRPLLVLGSALRTFLENRRSKGRTKCQPGELYCFRCHMPKIPALKMVDCIRLTDKTVNLQGLCPDCGVLICRCVSLARLDDVRSDLEITMPRVQPRLSENGPTGVNCHSGGEGDVDENAQRRQ